MPRKQITRINPHSAAKVGGLLYCGLGLIAALLFAVVPELAPQPIPREVLIFLPFFNLFAGFVGGLLLAGFYNLIANTIGGVIIEVADEQPPREPQ